MGVVRDESMLSLVFFPLGAASNWNFDADAVDAFETPDEPDDIEDEHDKDGEAIEELADALRTQAACKLEFLSFSNEMRWIWSANVLKTQDQTKLTQLNACKNTNLMLCYLLFWTLCNVPKACA